MKLLPLLLLLLLSACGGGGGDSPPSKEPDAGSDADAGDPKPRTETFHTERGRLVDREGRTLTLRGVNLASAHKKTPYLGFHRKEDFARIRDAWGMNAVRFLLVWAAVEPEKGAIDEAYLDEVKKRMDWAHDAGLLVVLDMHQDVYGEGFGGDGAPRWTCDEKEYAAFEPAAEWYLNYENDHVVRCFDRFWASSELREHYASAWAAVAARLKDHPAVVGFDVMNEPFWGSKAFQAFERDVLGPFYEDVVGAVRKKAPDWVAFLEPASSRNLGFPTSLVLSGIPSVVYAPHSYDIGAERGSGFDPSRRGALVANIAELRAEADGFDAPLWIGEYGGNADQPGIGPYMDAQYDGAAKAGAGSMVWAYDRDSGYGLLAPDGSEKPKLLDVLVRPFPERVAGDGVTFSFDAVARRFELGWRPLPGIDAETILSLPARVYPKGYDVECGGCAFEKAAGTLRIPTVEAERVVVVIAPR